MQVPFGRTIRYLGSCGAVHFSNVTLCLHGKQLRLYAVTGTAPSQNSICLVCPVPGSSLLEPASVSWMGKC